MTRKITRRPPEPNDDDRLEVFRQLQAEEQARYEEQSTVYRTEVILKVILVLVGIWGCWMVFNILDGTVAI